MSINNNTPELYSLLGVVYCMCAQACNLSQSEY